LFRESDTLSPNIRASLREDLLLDCVLSNADLEHASSPQDYKLATTAYLKDIVIMDQATTLSGSVDRIAINAWMYKMSNPIKEDKKLSSKLLKLAKKTLTLTTPIVVKVRIDGKPRLAVRIPKIADESEGAKDNLGMLLKWAMLALAIKEEDVLINEDSTLGDSVLSPAPITKLIQTMTGSLETSKGLFPGEVYTFPSGFKGNLVEVLAAIRLLRRDSEKLRKKTAPKGKKNLATTVEDLRELFNSKSGLTAKDIPNWTFQFIKGILAELVKTNNDSFPGGWIHACKVRNDTKVSLGVENKLGYLPKICSEQKLDVVLKTNTEVVKKVKELVSSKDKDGNVEKKTVLKEIYGYEKVDPKKEPEGITHREYRLGVLLALPRLDPLKSENFKDDIKRDPMSFDSLITYQVFNDLKDVVDAVNAAYAFKVASLQKGSKTTPNHFRMGKERAVNLSANRSFKDRNGTEYQAYKDIPTNVKEFLEKHFVRKTNKDSSDANKDTEERKARGDMPPPATPSPERHREPSLQRSGAVRRPSQERPPGSFPQGSPSGSAKNTSPKGDGKSPPKNKK
jgi:hypothetical protein